MAGVVEELRRRIAEKLAEEEELLIKAGFSDREVVVEQHCGFENALDWVCGQLDELSKPEVLLSKNAVEINVVEIYGLPVHCSHCYRWSTAPRGTPCYMQQPNGTFCQGMFN